MSAPQPLSSTAAELVARRVAAMLELRLAWLAADEQGTDRPEHESEWRASRQAVDPAVDDGASLVAWQRLVQLFRLVPAEADLLAVAVAVAVEPALGPRIAHAQGAPGRLLPTEPLVKRLFGHGVQPIWRATSPLAMWGLLHPVRRTPGEPPAFEADATIVDWLFGTLSLDSALALAVERCVADYVVPEWRVDEVAARAALVLAAGSDTRIVVRARAGTGRLRFAAAVARLLGKEAIVVDPAALPGGGDADAFMRVQRFALYADLAVIWRQGSPEQPRKIPVAPLQAVCVADDAPLPPREACVDLTVRLPEPLRATKVQRFCELMPDLAASAEQLVATPGLSLGDIENVARAAPRTVDEAAEQLRSHARARLRDAGHVVDPRFSWQDLVAQPGLIAELRQIAFEARMRPALFEDAEAARLFQGAAGLSALFFGPPGVGKSMAAQVIARELGVNLLVVDLAATTSRYVGETAKNLSRCFEQARAAGAALAFEEADAFFARRTDVKDANDRHSNADTGHLLQLMDAHDGLVILSTNRRANIDGAFLRRIRHTVEFSLPGPKERCTLWLRMLVGLGVDSLRLLGAVESLADSHELSPAQIKGAALSAFYAALASGRGVCADDLAAGAARELTKEGRSAPLRSVDAAIRRRMRNGAHV